MLVPATAARATVMPALVMAAVLAMMTAAAARRSATAGMTAATLGTVTDPARAKATAMAPRARPKPTTSSVEGVDLDPEIVGEAEPILRELNLTNDQAKKFVPIAAKMMDRAVDATVNDIVAKGNAQRKEWLDSAKAAEDIGGAKWDATMHMAAKGLDALGFVKADKDKNVEAHPFRLALEQTGFGNHPDMIRMAAKLGELVSEDGDFVRADASAPGAKGDVAKRLYPND